MGQNELNSFKTFDDGDKKQEKIEVLEREKQLFELEIKSLKDYINKLEKESEEKGQEIERLKESEV